VIPLARAYFLKKNKLNLTPEEEAKLSFGLSVNMNSKKPFVMYSETQEELLNWINILTECIANANLSKVRSRRGLEFFGKVDKASRVLILTATHITLSEVTTRVKIWEQEYSQIKSVRQAADNNIFIQSAHSDQSTVFWIDEARAATQAYETARAAYDKLVQQLNQSNDPERQAVDSEQRVVDSDDEEEDDESQTYSKNEKQQSQQ